MLTAGTLEAILNSESYEDAVKLIHDSGFSKNGSGSDIVDGLIKIALNDCRIGFSAVGDPKILIVVRTHLHEHLSLVALLVVVIVHTVRRIASVLRKLADHIHISVLQFGHCQRKMGNHIFCLSVAAVNVALANGKTSKLGAVVGITIVRARLVDLKNDVIVRLVELVVVNAYAVIVGRHRLKAAIFIACGENQAAIVLKKSPARRHPLRLIDGYEVVGTTVLHDPHFQILIHIVDRIIARVDLHAELLMTFVIINVGATRHRRNNTNLVFIERESNLQAHVVGLVLGIDLQQIVARNYRTDIVVWKG